MTPITPNFDATDIEQILSQLFSYGIEFALRTTALDDNSRISLHKTAKDNFHRTESNLTKSKAKAATSWNIGIAGTAAVYIPIISELTKQ